MKILSKHLSLSLRNFGQLTINLIVSLLRNERNSLVEN